MFKIRWFVIIIAFLSFVSIGAPQRATAFVPGAPQGGTTTVLNFFGMPVTCSSGGHPVVFTFNYALNDVGNTQFGDAYRPTVITLNPDNIMAMVNVDPHVGLFWIGHECGHAFLLTGDESAADCWSATVGAKQGWFTRNNLPAMWAVLQNNPGNWSHPPGPVRWQHIKQCLLAAGG